MRPGRAAALTFAIAAAIGTAGAWHIARLALTLSHYDARAHLVVARRIVDNLTPGWRQIGALWLPLPHLVNALPVCWDWNYRSGMSGVAISVLALAAGLAALATFFYRQSQSMVVAVVVPLAILLNPNVLYLQSTPMTEPLLWATTFLSLMTLDTWMRDRTDNAGRTPTRATRSAIFAGSSLAALALTRYEGWAIAAMMLVIVLGATRFSRVEGRAFVFGLPMAAVVAFLLLSRASTGVWLITSGFFVADNPSRGHLGDAIRQVYDGLVALGGPALVIAALGGVAACAARTRTSRGASLLPLALFAAALLPISAFADGHPYRVRYMVSLVVACGVVAGMFVSSVPRQLRAIFSLGLAALLVVQRPPFSTSAPVVLEAQWETPFREARATVTRYLSTYYRGEPILASMGSLGHYMQETSAIGLRIADFVHEGNGDLWLDAIAFPRRHVGWILIEERAEGGDELAMRARREPDWLSGFSRVAEGGGLALFQNLTKTPKFK